MQESELQDSEFDSFLQRMQQRQREWLNLGDHLSKNYEPAQASEALRLQVGSGLPLDTVFRNLKSEQAKQSQLSPAQIESMRLRAPSVAEWSTHPIRRAASRQDEGDLDRLIQLEESIKQLKKPVFRESTDEELRPLVETAQRERAAKDFADQVSAQEGMKAEEEAGLPPTQPRTSYGSLKDMEEAYIKDAMNTLRRKQAFMAGQTDKTTFMGRASEALSLGYEQGGQMQDLGRLGLKKLMGDETFQDDLEIRRLKERMAQTPQGEDFASRFLFPAAKIAGQMVDATSRSLERGAQGALMGGVAGMAGGPASPATVPGGMVSGFGLGMTTGMAEQAFITEAGNAYVELDEIRGKNGEALDKDTMKAAASVVGLLNAGLEMVGLHYLSAPAKKLASKFITGAVKDAAADTIARPTIKRAFIEFFKDYGKTLLSETSTEVMQEVVNVLGENVSKMASSGEFATLLNSPEERDAAIERLLGIASETLRGTALIGLPGATVNLAHDVQVARHTNEVLKSIDKLYEALTIKNDNPQEVEAISRAAAAQAGIPTLTVAAGPVAEYYQSQGIDPVQRIAELTGNGETFAQAAKEGGDFQIPTEKYVTMPKEEKAFYQEHVRTDPMHMSQADTQSIVAGEQAKIDEANKVEAARAEALARDVEAQKKLQETKESVQRVADEIQNALSAAGFKREAATVAKAVSSVFKTLGQRENLDPYKLFSERPLTVTREGKLPVDDSGQVYAQPDEAGTSDRGNIFIGDAKVNIDLLKTADPSTFLHETGHLYLDLLGRLASREQASHQIKKDFQTVREWVGAKEGEKLSKAQHEQWAKSFERYLKEGKAPSVALRGAFYRFKQWLADVYQGMKETLGLELNDSIRGVMDRLLATDEEIAQAQESQAQAPLFEDAKAAGATDAQAQKYAELVQKATQAAEEKLLHRAMEQARRESSEWWAAEREKIRQAVEKEVSEEPVYKAIAAMKEDGGLKIDSRMAGEVFGGFDVDRKAFPRGFFAKEGGLHPDIVAGMFQFEDGRRLLKAIQTAEKMADRIERITDERMKAEFGDEPTEAEIKDAALASIHSDSRAEQIALEIQILASGNKGLLKLVTASLPNIQAVRKAAERAIGGTKLRSINPKLFLAAERRAAKAAINEYGSGKIREAILQKQLEIVNHENFRAADAAKEDVADSFERWKPLLRKSDEKLSKTRDVDFVNAARAILARINIGDADKQASSFLEPIKQYDPELYADMIALVDEAVPEANREYKDLTYDEFKRIQKAVDALWNKSLSANQISLDGKRLHLDEVKKPLMERMDKIEPAKESKATLDDKDKAAGMLRGGLASVTRVEHWASAMGKEFMEAFPLKMHEGTDAYREFIDDWLGRYKTILDKLPKLSRAPIYSEDLDFTFKGGKRELLGALLHAGNSEDGSSNLWKLLLGRGWATLDKETGQIDTSKWDRFIEKMQKTGVLTEKDYDFAQSVWDLFEEIKPLLQKAHKQMNGFHFNEVTATPFQAFGKEYRGGYFPALADPNEVADAAIRGEKAEAEVGNSYALPTAGSGATKNRSKSYWKKLRMDLDAVPQHIKWAGRYINIEPHVQELRRLLWNKEFRERLDQFNPAAAGSMLVPWLQRSATQTVEAPIGGGKAGKFLSAAAHWLKGVSGAKQLGLNFINAAQNVEGIAVAGTKVPYTALASAMKSVLTNPMEAHKAIAELSPYMKHRTQEVVGQLQESVDDILKDPTLWQNMKRLSMKHVFVLSKITQGLVDDIVWTAAFNDAQAKDATLTDQQAAKKADSIVRLTQGSSAAEDISAYESGNAFMRLFTMYMSWFNMRANLIGSEGVKIMREEMGVSKRAQKLAVLTAMSFTIPALIGKAISMLGRGDPLDKDEDGYIDDLLAYFFGAQYQEAKAMVPVVGPAVDVMANRFDSNPTNDNVNVSPAFSTIGQLLSTPGEVYEAVTTGKGKGKAVEDVLTTMGVVTGIPFGAVGKQARYAVELAEGKREPSGPVDLIRGILTGTGSRAAR